MPRYLIPFAFFLLTACSSTHDLKRDGINPFGGGFIDDEIGPGLYLIKAFSNTSMFVTRESAAKTFDYRAKQLCPAGYEEVHAVTNAYRAMLAGSTMSSTVYIDMPGTPGNPDVLLPVLAPNPFITSKIGHIRCLDAPITLEEAIALLYSEDE